ncbi:hypothetical protein [Nocardia sp. NPDC005978]|uniref:hypothetical protein n=1 Tax=unclassified Nocardia TaxID=2637762 RepID=UPI0033A5B544
MQGPDAQRLLAEILNRYGTLDAFINSLRHGADRPTTELPRITEADIAGRAQPLFAPIVATPLGGGRHARPD